MGVGRGATRVAIYARVYTGEQTPRAATPQTARLREPPQALPIPSGNIASIWSGCGEPNPGFPANAVVSSILDLQQSRRERLMQQIEELLPNWSMAPVVAALQSMRGSPFSGGHRSGGSRRLSPLRQSPAADGLSRPGTSEHSSGSSVRRGGITRAGNALARHVLIEDLGSRPTIAITISMALPNVALRLRPPYGIRCRSRRSSTPSLCLPIACDCRRNELSQSLNRQTLALLDPKIGGMSGKAARAAREIISLGRQRKWGPDYVPL